MEGSLIFVTAFILVSFISGIESTNFNIKNNCPYTIWPATVSINDSPPLPTTGFALDQGATSTIGAPANWTGRIWARTFCATNKLGRFRCRIGDCGTGQISCNGKSGAPPATLVQIVLNGNGEAVDEYDISLVDGFNLPVAIAPAGCLCTSCAVDINTMCSPNLAIRASNGRVIGCNNEPLMFRAQCPLAYTLTPCPTGRDYLITFCP